MFAFFLCVVAFHGCFKNGCVQRMVVFRNARVMRTPLQHSSNGKEARPVRRLASSSLQQKNRQVFCLRCNGVTHYALQARWCGLPTAFTRLSALQDNNQRRKLLYTMYCCVVALNG
jgi:hypothetical protein